MVCERFLSIFWCVGLIFFSSFVASQDKEWLVKDIPHPYNSTYNATLFGPYISTGSCGPEEGFVCNPDGILTAEQVKHLNEVIRQKVIEPSNCGCYCPGDNDEQLNYAIQHKVIEPYRYGCSCREDRDGLTPAIIVVKNVSIAGSYFLKPEWKQNRMNDIAEEIRKKWKIGDCDNDLVILVVADYKEWITPVTGGMASIQLDKSCLNAIFEQYRDFPNTENIADTLEKILDDIGYSTTHVNCAVSKNGDYRYVDTYRTGEVVAVVIGALFCLCVVLLCVGTLFYCDRKTSGMDPGEIERMANEAALRKEKAAKSGRVGQHENIHLVASGVPPEAEPLFNTTSH